MLFPTGLLADQTCDHWSSLVSVSSQVWYDSTLVKVLLHFEGYSNEENRYVHVINEQFSDIFAFEFLSLVDLRGKASFS